MTNLSDTARDFHEVSYERHAGQFGQLMTDTTWRKVMETWFDETTADYWQHARMYEAAELITTPQDTWMTVGDGRFGLDSIRLRRRGTGPVMATDIAPDALTESKAKGLIDQFSVENAEKLSFPTGNFDYVLCKEAFHHLPRPYLGLYEMLRVSRKGVVLIEPQDQRRSIIMNLIYAMRRLTGKQQFFDQRRYEGSGNYIYSVSRREFEKACLGIDLPCVMFKGVTALYLSGLEFAPASYSSPKYLKLRFGVWLNGLLTRLGLSVHNILCTVILKSAPSPEIRARFQQNGWTIVDLPRNPYGVSALPMEQAPDIPVM